jgi:hypothetical protein
MALIWIPTTEKLPPTDEWVIVRTSDIEFPYGETIAKPVNGHWYTRTYKRINNVTHWAFHPDVCENGWIR